MSNESPGPVLILVRDLMFSGRVTATARAEGVPFKVERDPATLAGQEGRLLIVDLNQPGAIEAASQWAHATNRPAVGFVSHVDTATATKAREAGITQVLARSRFVEVLPELLRA